MSERTTANSGRAMVEPPLTPEEGADEPPPLLGRWSRLYAVVALELVIVIVVLWWLTRRFT